MMSVSLGCAGAIDHADGPVCPWIQDTSLARPGKTNRTAAIRGIN